MTSNSSGENSDTAVLDTLLGVTERLVVEEGMDAVSLDALAERAGLDVAEVSRYFAYPGAAISAVIAADEARFLRAAQPEAGTVPPSERLRALIEACVSEYDWTLWIELWSQALREPWAIDLRQQLDDEFRVVVTDLIREGQATGEFAATDPERAATILACLVDGFATQATLGDSRVSAHYMQRACLLTVDRLLTASSPMGVKAVDV